MLASFRGLTRRSYRSFVNASPTTRSGTAIFACCLRAEMIWRVAQAWWRSSRLAAAISSPLSARTASAVDRLIDRSRQVHGTLDRAQVAKEGVALAQLSRQPD